MQFLPNIVIPAFCKTPFVRKSREGGEASFTDPAELIKYVKVSEAAAYMWCDSIDLTIIAEMYQIIIKIISTKRTMDKNPIVNRIYPDETMKDGELGDMGLLHEDDIHFNLVAKKDSDLATMGADY